MGKEFVALTKRAKQEVAKLPRPWGAGSVVTDVEAEKPVSLYVLMGEGGVVLDLTAEEATTLARELIKNAEHVAECLEKGDK